MNDIATYEKEYNALTDQMGRIAAGADNFKIELSLLEKAGYLPGMSILDYGCGWGSLLEVIDGPYIGVDISPLMIGFAKEKYPEKDFHQSSVGTVNVDPVDIVVAHSVFTHIPRNILEFAMSDVVRNLKKDGFAVIDIYYPSQLDGLYEAYSHKEWVEMLDIFSLKAEYLGSRERAMFFTHHYYKVWQQ